MLFLLLMLLGFLLKGKGHNENYQVYIKELFFSTIFFFICFVCGSTIFYQYHSETCVTLVNEEQISEIFNSQHFWFGISQLSISYFVYYLWFCTFLFKRIRIYGKQNDWCNRTIMVNHTMWTSFCMQVSSSHRFPRQWRMPVQ